MEDMFESIISKRLNSKPLYLYRAETPERITMWWSNGKPHKTIIKPKKELNNED